MTQNNTHPLTSVVLLAFAGIVFIMLADSLVPTFKQTYLIFMIGVLSLFGALVILFFWLSDIVKKIKNN